MSLDFHQSPEAMARCLVTYIPNDKRVQTEVYATFGSAPSLSTIADIRQSRLREKLPRGGYLAGSIVYNNDEYERHMAYGSKRLLEAICAAQRP